MSEDPSLRKPRSDRGYRVAAWVGGLGLLLVPIALVFAPWPWDFAAVLAAAPLATVWAVGRVGRISADESRQDLGAIYAMTKSVR